VPDPGVTPVRWTEQAVEDLRRTREFIGRDSLRYGRLVAERLYDATSRLEAFPRSGRYQRWIGMRFAN
jgi:plasmid stabilization system protein ParE